MAQEYIHRSVLLDECIEALNIHPEGTYLDGTLGRAGHSLEIVRRLTTGRLICIDRDDAAIEAAKIKLADYMDKKDSARAIHNILYYGAREYLKGIE